MGRTKALLDDVDDTNDGLRSLSLDSSQSRPLLWNALCLCYTGRMINTMYPYRSLNHGKPFDFYPPF